MPSIDDSHLSKGRANLGDVDDFARLLRVLRTFGITNGYEMLEAEATTPETCMAIISQHLELLGIGGRKWIRNPWFEERLKWLDRRAGKVRFLLSAQMQGTEELQRYQELKMTYPNVFDCRFYHQKPVFRIVLLDRRLALVSHYGHDILKDQAALLGGWESPQLVCESSGEWSLGMAFSTLFEAIWDGAEELPEMMEEEASTRRHRQFD